MTEPSNYKKAEEALSTTRNPEARAVGFAMLAVADQLRLQSQIELAHTIHNLDEKVIRDGHYKTRVRESYRKTLRALLEAVTER